MRLHKKALAMFQISDLVFTGEGLSAVRKSVEQAVGSDIIFGSNS